MFVAINSVKACPRTQHSERLVIQFRYVPGVLIIVPYTCIVRSKSTVNMLLQFSVLSVVDTFFWNKDLSSIRKCDISSSQHPFSNTLMWTACTTGMTLTIQNHTLLPSVILITRHGMQIVSISQHRISLIEIQMQLKLFVSIRSIHPSLSVNVNVPCIQILTSVVAYCNSDCDIQNWRLVKWLHILVCLILTFVERKRAIFFFQFCYSWQHRHT